MGGKRGYGIPQPKGGVNGGANGFARANGSSHYSRYFRPKTFSLLTITNKKEVLRVTIEEAQKKFFNNKKIFSRKWFYTTKAAYNQYIESKKKGSKIKRPKFKIKAVDSNLKNITIPIHIYKTTN